MSHAEREVGIFLCYQSFNTITSRRGFLVFYLDGVEPAVAIEGEADDVCWVLVPASVDWVTHDISSLREDLLNENLLPTQGNPLAQVRCDTNHQAVAGLRHPSLLTLLLPALQLLDHGCQLVIACLLIQQVEVLYKQMNMEKRDLWVCMCAVVHGPICVTITLWVLVLYLYITLQGHTDKTQHVYCATLRWQL